MYCVRKMLNHNIFVTPQFTQYGCPLFCAITQTLKIWLSSLRVKRFSKFPSAMFVLFWLLMFGHDSFILSKNPTKDFHRLLTSISTQLSYVTKFITFHHNTGLITVVKLFTSKRQCDQIGRFIGLWARF